MAASMESVVFSTAQADAMRGALAAALEAAGNKAAGKLADQRAGMEALVLQMGQQQVEIAGNMQAIQSSRESTKSIMEQFNAEAQTTKVTMKNLSVGLAQMESRIVALWTAKEGIGAEVT